MDAMTNRRILGVGAFLLLAGGCASQPQASPQTTNIPLQNKPVATQVQPPSQTVIYPPVQQPAPLEGPQLLARKTNEFANTMNGADPANTSGGGGSAALFTDAAGTTGRKGNHKRIDPAPPTDDSASAAPVDGSAISRPASMLGQQNGGSAQLAGAPLSPGSARANSSSDEPRIVPESADLASPAASGEMLAKKLMKRVRENPRDISNQLDLQLFGMLNDDQSPELAAMSMMPVEDRELVSTLIDGLSNFRSTVRQDANMLPQQKTKPLLEMAERLRSLADLNVSTVALCKRVEAFGKYDPYFPARFPAMKDNWVIVYCEVENFVPKQNPQQMWETNLNEQVTLYTDTGLLVWSDNKQEVNDECRNRRHDFFAYNKIMLPSSLSAGRYVLKVTIEDENADRVAEASVPLSIGAQ
jgi:hypothetical protein